MPLFSCRTTRQTVTPLWSRAPLSLRSVPQLVSRQCSGARPQSASVPIYSLSSMLSTPRRRRRIFAHSLRTQICKLIPKAYILSATSCLRLGRSLDTINRKHSSEVNFSVSTFKGSTLLSGSKHSFSPSLMLFAK